MGVDLLEVGSGLSEFSNRSALGNPSSEWNRDNVVTERQIMIRSYDSKTGLGQV